MKYKFEKIAHETGKKVLKNCYQLSLDHFKLKRFNDNNTLIDFVKELKMNNVKYGFYSFTPEKFKTKKGFVLFFNEKISHIAPFESGVYHDIYNMFNKKLPDYIITIEI